MKGRSKGESKAVMIEEHLPISKLQSSTLSVCRPRCSQVGHKGVGLIPNGSDGCGPKCSQVEHDSGTLLQVW